METSIITALQRVRQDIINGTISTSGELASRMSEAMTIKAGDLRLPRYAPSEPPISIKLNAIAQQIDKAVRDRSYVFDILSAAAVFDHDLAMRAIDDLENRVLGLVDTVKALYLFSKPAKAGVRIVSSDFTMSNGVFSGPSAISRQTGAGCTLPIVEEVAEPCLPIISGSGLTGNWFVEVNGILKSKSSKCHEPEYLGDTDPTTWFEWQNFRISQATFEKTQGYGFGFSDTDLKWADVNTDKVELVAHLNYPAPIWTNYIVITPAIECPEFTVKKIALFLNGQQVREVGPSGLIVNTELLMHGEDGYTNEGNFLFPATACDQIVVDLVSTKAIPCQIRHSFKNDENGDRAPVESPSILEPERYIDGSFISNTEYEVETLPADRFFIAIKDISVQRLTFSSEGYASTETIMFDKPIDRMAIAMDADTPMGTSVTFQASFNDGQSWYNVNALGTSINRQVIAVNDMIPPAYQDPSTLYIIEDKQPQSFIARMYLKRDIGNTNDTPLVRSVEFEVSLKP